jgi:hypothetical protein
MTVGKPNFNLNSFGIQYKEKNVKYVNKLIGFNSKIQTETDEDSEHAKWSKMGKPQSEASKKRKEKPNALQAVSSAPTETPTPTHMVDGKQVEKPKKSKYGRQDIKEIAYSATSPPPTTPHEESTNVLVDVPYTKEEMVTREGGSSYYKTHPHVPKASISGRANQEATIKLSESKANPILPKVKKGADEVILKTMLLKLDINKAISRNAGATNLPKGTKEGKEDYHDLVGDGQQQNGVPTGKGHGRGSSHRVMIEGQQVLVPRKTAVIATGNDKTGQKGDKYMGTKESNNITHDDFKEAERRTAEANPSIASLLGYKTPESLGSGTDKHIKTQAELDKEFYEKVQPEPTGKGRKKSMDELIRDMDILKLDLMKGKNGALPKPTKNHIKNPTDWENFHGSDLERQNLIENQVNSPEDREMATYNITDLDSKNKKPSPKSALGKSAAETIFKAISLKLDLMNVDKGRKKQSKLGKIGSAIASKYYQDAKADNFNDSELRDNIDNIRGVVGSKIIGNRDEAAAYANEHKDRYSPKSWEYGKEEILDRLSNAPKVTNELSHNVLNNMKYRESKNDKE